MEAEVSEILLPGKSFEESDHHADLIKSSSSGLKWVILDYSTIWRAGLSWSIFFLLNVFVPIVSHAVFSCSRCDPDHRRPFDALSDEVRQGYTLQIHDHENRIGSSVPTRIYPVDSDNEEEMMCWIIRILFRSTRTLYPIDQKRQALVTYLENNKAAGITVYGFMLDRTWLHTIVAIQLSLTLWILNKTIGIS